MRLEILIAQSEYHHQALQRSVPFSVPGIEQELSVVASEDLILLKLLAGRLIDRVDVQALLRNNRECLDFDYLFQWGGKLKVAQPLEAAWYETFPGEERPSGNP